MGNTELLTPEIMNEQKVMMNEDSFQPSTQMDAVMNKGWFIQNAAGLMNLDESKSQNLLSKLQS